MSGEVRETHGVPSVSDPWRDSHPMVSCCLQRQTIDDLVAWRAVIDLPRAQCNPGRWQGGGRNGVCRTFVWQYLHYPFRNLPTHLLLVCSLSCCLGALYPTRWRITSGGNLVERPTNPSRFPDGIRARAPSNLTIFGPLSSRSLSVRL